MLIEAARTPDERHFVLDDDYVNLEMHSSLPFIGIEPPRITALLASYTGYIVAISRKHDFSWSSHLKLPSDSHQHWVVFSLSLHIQNRFTGILASAEYGVCKTHTFKIHLLLRLNQYIPIKKSNFFSLLACSEVRTHTLDLVAIYHTIQADTVYPNW